jgi:hypothetical protein
MERFQLAAPPDFPAELLERVHIAISDPDEARRQTPEWAEWAGACNGLLYRFLACAEHGDAVVDSLIKSTSPPQPERYEQEKLLFDFFAEGLSALECLYYGVYFIGALADPGGLAATVDKRQVAPGHVTKCFEATYAGEALTGRLRAVLSTPEYSAWRDTRNVLSHRSSPGRDFRTGGSDAGTYWMGSELSADVFGPRRAWLASSIDEILSALELFVQTRLN